MASLKVVNVSFNSWFVVKTAKKTSCKVLSIILTIMTTAVREECVMNYMYYAFVALANLRYINALNNNNNNNNKPVSFYW